MTTLDEKICEQLSAWMDGELPADEARFLERRLANEPELRKRWERMQLAASCLKGHTIRPMPATLATRVAAAIAEPTVPTRTRRPWLGWAVAASVALLAVVFVPDWTGGAERGGTVVAQTAPEGTGPVDAVPVFVPNPSSADLIARADNGAALPNATPARASRSDTTLELPTPASNGAQSPADFPLVAASDGKAWPRSPLSAGGNDPALEAYLIRHDQMMGDAGLNAFVPYVDVVTNESGAADANSDEEVNR